MKKILLILVFTIFSLNAIAQGGRGEKLKALKIAFITERLDLTENEAQGFWPIFNAFEEERRMLLYTEKEKLRQINNDLTDEEAEKLLNDLLKFEEEKVKLKNDFYRDLLKAIPAKKILLLQKTEEDFKRQMLEQFKRRRQGKP